MPDQSTGTSKLRRRPAKYSATWASAVPSWPSAGPAVPPAAFGRGPAWPDRPGGGPKRTLATPAALQATDISPTGEASAPQASSLTAVLLTPPLSLAAPTSSLVL